MRCSKARELIALSGSGDVTTAESRRVSQHAERCAACRALAAADPLPYASLRTSVPLRDEAYAAVRARVLADLAEVRRPAFLIPMRLAAAAAAVLIVFVGMATLRMNRESAPDGARSETVATAIAPPSAAAPPLPAAADATLVPLPPKHAPKTASPSTRPVPRGPRQPSFAPSPEIAAALEQPAELRIQIQTADPAIRIIWIANPSHDDSPTSSEEKS